ncbi:hypothetical protein EPN16_07735, partial [bacterium]
MRPETKRKLSLMGDKGGNYAPKPLFKSSFKKWIRITAFIVAAIFIPEQASWAVEYDWSTLFPRAASVSGLNQGDLSSPRTFSPSYTKDITQIDIPLAIKKILLDISNKPINAVKISDNLTVELKKPLKMSKQRIEEIYNWLKGKPCGTSALYDYLQTSKAAVPAEQDIAVLALTVDIINDVVKPEGNPEIIKNSLFALSKASEFFGRKLLPVKFNLGSRTNEPANSRTPFIAHLKNEHYVLVTRITPEKVYFSSWHKEEFLPFEKFLEYFSGYALIPHQGQLPAGTVSVSDEEAKAILGAKRSFGKGSDLFANEPGFFEAFAFNIGIPLLTAGIGNLASIGTSAFLSNLAVSFAATQVSRAAMDVAILAGAPALAAQGIGMMVGSMTAGGLTASMQKESVMFGIAKGAIGGAVGFGANYGLNQMTKKIIKDPYLRSQVVGLVSMPITMVAMNWVDSNVFSKGQSQIPSGTEISESSGAQGNIADYQQDLGPLAQYHNHEPGLLGQMLGSSATQHLHMDAPGTSTTYSFTAGGDYVGFQSIITQPDVLPAGSSLWESAKFTFRNPQLQNFLVSQSIGVGIEALAIETGFIKPAYSRILGSAAGGLFAGGLRGDFGWERLGGALLRSGISVGLTKLSNKTKLPTQYDALLHWAGTSVVLGVTGMFNASPEQSYLNAFGENFLQGLKNGALAYYEGFRLPTNNFEWVQYHQAFWERTGLTAPNPSLGTVGFAESARKFEKRTGQRWQENLYSLLPSFSQQMINHASSAFHQAAIGNIMNSNGMSILGYLMPEGLARSFDIALSKMQSKWTAQEIESLNLTADQRKMLRYDEGTKKWSFMNNGNEVGFASWQDRDGLWRGENFFFQGLSRTLSMNDKLIDIKWGLRDLQSARERKLDGAAMSGSLPGVSQGSVEYEPIDPNNPSDANFANLVSGLQFGGNIQSYSFGAYEPTDKGYLHKVYYGDSFGKGLPLRGVNIISERTPNKLLGVIPWFDTVSAINRGAAFVKLGDNIEQAKVFNSEKTPSSLLNQNAKVTRGAGQELWLIYKVEERESNRSFIVKTSDNPDSKILATVKKNEHFPMQAIGLMFTGLNGEITSQVAGGDQKILPGLEVLVPVINIDPNGAFDPSAWGGLTSPVSAAHVDIYGNGKGKLIWDERSQQVMWDNEMRATAVNNVNLAGQGPDKMNAAGGPAAGRLKPGSVSSFENTVKSSLDKMFPDEPSLFPNDSSDNRVTSFLDFPQEQAPSPTAGISTIMQGFQTEGEKIIAAKDDPLYLLRNDQPSSATMAAGVQTPGDAHLYKVEGREFSDLADARKYVEKRQAEIADSSYSGPKSGVGLSIQILPAVSLAGEGLVPSAQNAQPQAAMSLSLPIAGGYDFEEAIKDPLYLLHNDQPIGASSQSPAGGAVTAATIVQVNQSSELPGSGNIAAAVVTTQPMNLPAMPPQAAAQQLTSIQGKPTEAIVMAIDPKEESGETPSSSLIYTGGRQEVIPNAIGELLGNTQPSLFNGKTPAVEMAFGDNIGNSATPSPGATMTVKMESTPDAQPTPTHHFTTNGLEGDYFTQERLSSETSDEMNEWARQTNQLLKEGGTPLPPDTDAMVVGRGAPLSKEQKMQLMLQKVRENTNILNIAAEELNGEQKFLKTLKAYGIEDPVLLAAAMIYEESTFGDAILAQEKLSTNNKWHSSHGLLQIYCKEDCSEEEYKRLHEDVQYNMKRGVEILKSSFYLAKAYAEKHGLSKEDTVKEMLRYYNGSWSKIQNARELGNNPKLTEEVNRYQGVVLENYGLILQAFRKGTINYSSVSSPNSITQPTETGKVSSAPSSDNLKNNKPSLPPELAPMLSLAGELLKSPLGLLSQAPAPNQQAAAPQSQKPQGITEDLTLPKPSPSANFPAGLSLTTPLTNELLGSPHGSLFLPQDIEPAKLPSVPQVTTTYVAPAAPPSMPPEQTPSVGMPLLDIPTAPVITAAPPAKAPEISPDIFGSYPSLPGELLKEQELPFAPAPLEPTKVPSVPQAAIPVSPSVPSVLTADQPQAVGTTPLPDIPSLQPLPATPPAKAPGPIDIDIFGTPSSLPGDLLKEPILMSSDPKTPAISSSIAQAPETPQTSYAFGKSNPQSFTYSEPDQPPALPQPIPEMQPAATSSSIAQAPVTPAIQPQALIGRENEVYGPPIELAQSQAVTAPLAAPLPNIKNPNNLPLYEKYGVQQAEAPAMPPALTGRENEAYGPPIELAASPSVDGRQQQLDYAFGEYLGEMKTTATSVPVAQSPLPSINDGRQQQLEYSFGEYLGEAKTPAAGVQGLGVPYAKIPDSADIPNIGVLEPDSTIGNKIATAKIPEAQPIALTGKENTNYGNKIATAKIPEVQATMPHGDEGKITGYAGLSEEMNKIAGRYGMDLTKPSVAADSHPASVPLAPMTVTSRDIENGLSYGEVDGRWGLRMYAQNYNNYLKWKDYGGIPSGLIPHMNTPLEFPKGVAPYSFIHGAIARVKLGKRDSKDVDLWQMAALRFLKDSGMKAFQDRYAALNDINREQQLMEFVKEVFGVTEINDISDKAIKGLEIPVVSSEDIVIS